MSAPGIKLPNGLGTADTSFPLDIGTEYTVQGSSGSGVLPPDGQNYFNYISGNATISFQPDTDANVIVDYGTNGSKSTQDIFKYSSDDGNVWISDPSGSSDILELTDINSTDVTFTTAYNRYEGDQTGYDLVITVIATGKQITLDNFNFSQQTSYGPNEIIFADGISVTGTQVRSLIQTTTPIPAQIRFDDSFTFKDLSNNNVETAAADVYFSDQNDTIQAHSGQNTFFYASADGYAQINDYQNQVDNLVLTDLNLSDVTLSAAPSPYENDGNHTDLQILVNATGKIIDVLGQMDSSGIGIGSITFADGTVLNASQIAAAANSNPQSAELVIETSQQNNPNYPITSVGGDAINVVTTMGDTQTDGLDNVSNLRVDVYAGVGGNTPNLYPFGGGSISGTAIVYLHGMNAADVVWLQNPYASSDVVLYDTKTGDTFNLGHELDNGFNDFSNVIFDDGTNISRSQIESSYGGYVFNGSNTGFNAYTSGLSVYVGAGGGNLNLYGNAGTTIYYKSTDGNFSVNDTASTQAPGDTLDLTDLTQSEVTISQNVFNDVITVNATGQTITLDNQFASYGSGISSIEFADGSTLNVTSPAIGVLTTPSDTYQYNNTEYDLGTADQTRSVNVTNDDPVTILWAAGDGNEEFNIVTYNNQNDATLKITGLTESQVSIARNGDNIIVTNLLTGKTMTLDGGASAANYYQGVAQIVFDDGTVISRSTLSAMPSTGTDGTNGSNGIVYNLGPGDHPTTVYLFNDYGSTVDWDAGDGNETFNLNTWSSTAQTVLNLTNLTQADVTITRVNDDIVVTNIATGKTFDIQGGADPNNPNYGVSQIDFSDGSVVTRAQLELVPEVIAQDSSNVPGITYDLGAGDHGLVNLTHDDPATIIWGANDGNEEFNINSNNYDNDATLKITGLTPDQVSINSTGNNLIITNLLTGKTITIDAENTQGYEGVQTVVFDNGTVLTRQQISTQQTPVYLTDGDNGTNGSSDYTLNAFGFYTIYDAPGDRTINLNAWGQPSEPSVAGNIGQTVVYAKADGNLVINGYTYGPNSDSLTFADLNPSDLSFARVNNDLIITVNATGNTIDALGEWANYGSQGIQSITFADGTTLNRAQIDLASNIGPINTNNLAFTNYDLGKNNYGTLADPITAVNDSPLTVTWKNGDGNQVFAITSDHYQNDASLELPDMLPSQIALERDSSNNLYVVNIVTGNVLTFENQWQDEDVNIGQGQSNQFGIGQIVFSNGTIWNMNEIFTNTIVTPNGSGNSYDTANEPIITYDMGVGNDPTPINVTGNGQTIIKWASTDGDQTYNAYSYHYQNTTYLDLTDLDPNQVSLTRDASNNLYITNLATGAVLTFENEWQDSDVNIGQGFGNENGVGQITFANGTVWQLSDIFNNTYVEPNSYGNGYNLNYQPGPVNYDLGTNNYGTMANPITAIYDSPLNIIWKAGDGNQVYNIDSDHYQNSGVTLELPDLLPSQVSFTRDGTASLYVTDLLTGNVLTFQNQFDNGFYDTEYGIGNVVFADGTTWTNTEFFNSNGTDQIFDNTPVVGNSYGNTYDTSNQNGVTYDLGVGNYAVNTFHDTPLTIDWAKADGSQSFTIENDHYNNYTTLNLTNLLPTDVSLVQHGNDLIIENNATQATMTIYNQFDGDEWHGIGTLNFADGTSLDRDLIQESVSTGEIVVRPNDLVLEEANPLNQTTLSNGETVGYVLASHQYSDQNQNNIYTIVNSDGYYTLNPSTGLLTIANAAAIAALTPTDAGTLTDTVTVLVTDGNGLTTQATLNVDYYNPTPVNTLTLSFTDTPISSQYVQSGEYVGQASATHGKASQDIGDVYSLTYSGSTTGMFAINPTTGVVYVANPTAVEHDANVVENITVAVTDTKNVTVTQNESIALNVVKPQITGLTWASSGINEFLPPGTAVGRATATDLGNPSGTGTDPYTYTYALADSDNGRYTINAITGVVATADTTIEDVLISKTDYISITATNNNGQTFTRQVAVNVLPVDTAPYSPSFTAAAPIPENALAGTIIGTASALDREVQNPGILASPDYLTYSLAGPYAYLFNINASSGVLTLKTAGQLNYNSLPNPTVTVVVTDSQGLKTSELVTVHVADVNHAPTALVLTTVDGSLSQPKVKEYLAPNTVIGTLAGTDIDTTNNGDYLRYSLSVNPNNSFAVDPVTGIITVVNPTGFNYNANKTVSITAVVTDSQGLTYSKAFTLTVEQNAVPTAAAGSITTTQNTEVTTTLHGSAGDVGDGLSYALSGTPPAGVSLSGSTLIFAPGTAYKFLPAGQSETLSVSYIVTDTLTGLKSAPGTETITVTGLNDPPSAGTPAAITDTKNVAINIDPNTLLAAASDPDLGASLFISAVSGAVHGSVSATKDGNGHVTNIVFTPASGYVGTGQFSYTVSDGSLTSSTSVAINIQASGSNGGVAPTNLVLTEGTVYANQASGTTIATLTATDPDAASGDVLTYSISGANTSYFTVNAATGALSIKTGASVNPGSYALSETATNSFGQAITIQTPIVISTPQLPPTGLSFTENGSTVQAIKPNIANGSIVGTAQATDPLAVYGDTLTYSLSSNPSNMFSINASTGVVSISNDTPLAALIGSNLTLGIKATDGQNLSVTSNFSIAVAPETAPTVANLSLSTYAGQQLTASFNGQYAAGYGPLTYKIVSGPANGSLTVSGGSFTFTPDSYLATASLGKDIIETFTYQATDADKEVSNVGKVSIDVHGNPIANTDTLAIAPKETISISVASLLANDQAANGATLSISAIPATYLGTAVLSSDHQTITFSSSASQYGLISAFTYTLNDGLGGSATGKVNLVATAASGGSEVIDITGRQSETISVASLLALAHAPSGATLSFVSLQNTYKGTAVLSADKTSITFTDTTGVATGNSSDDAFSYQLADQYGNTTTGKVSLDVTAAALTAANETLKITPHQSETISVASLIGLSSITPGVTASITSLPASFQGTAVLSADHSSITFTDTSGGMPGSNANDAFTYQLKDQYGDVSTGKVSLTLSGPAFTIGNETLSIEAHQSETISAASLIGLGTSAAGMNLTIASLPASYQGIATLSADHTSITFTDTSGKATVNGQDDAFTFQVKDQYGDTETGKVSLNVTMPTATTETTSIHTTAPVLFSTASLLANINDPDGGSLKIVSLPAVYQATTALEADGSGVEFTSTYSANGVLAATASTNPDAFTYMVEDSLGNMIQGKVNVAVTPLVTSLTAGNQNVSSDGNLDLFNVSGGSHTISLTETAITTGSGPTQISHVPDTIAFTTESFGQTVISGFNTATSGAISHDVLQFTASSFGALANYQAMMAHATQVGSDTVISIDANDKITLQGIQKTALTSSDFHFV